MTTRDLVNHILLTGQKGYKDMEDGNRISDKMTLLVKEHIKAEAEKMVSERLKEYHLNEGYDVVIVGNPDKEIPGDIFEDIKVAALELGELRGLKVMITGFTANYLKTRDSHE